MEQRRAHHTTARKTSQLLFVHEFQIHGDSVESVTYRCGGRPPALVDFYCVCVPVRFHVHCSEDQTPSIGVTSPIRRQSVYLPHSWSLSLPFSRSRNTRLFWVWDRQIFRGLARNTNTLHASGVQYINEGNR